MKRGRDPLVAATVTCLLLVSAGTILGDSCPLPPPEPPLPDVEVPMLSADDAALLDDFGAALRRFRGLSLEEFLEDFGPRKAYLTGDRVPFTFVRGDANGDGGVDIADAVCTLSYLFLGEGQCAGQTCLDAHDVDDDGQVNLTDAIALLNGVFLGGPPPAPPYPNAGADPTPDDFSCAVEQGGKLDYDPLDSEYLDPIRASYPLSPDQAEVFEENGFVVLDDQRFRTFVSALFDVFERHLPVYFSADAMLDALHLSFDAMLQSIEEELLIDELERMLAKMEGGIGELAAIGASDGGIEDAAWWLCVARSLLAGEKLPCARDVDDNVDDDVAEFLELVAAEKCVEIDLFGNDQVEDFSQFKPRSHYTRSDRLQRYFRAMMWVQRMGTKFAQLPRHATAAYLLARLLEDTGAIEHWRVIDEVVRLFVGTSDSLNGPGMLELAASAGVRSAAELREADGFLRLVAKALETGAGQQLILSQVLRSNPTYLEGFTPIPPAFHLMGQRFIPDSFIFTNVVFDRVCCEFTIPSCPLPCRGLPSPLDAWFALGNRAALPLLEPELRTYEHQANLAALDWILSSYPDEFWSSSLYNAWLSALRTLSADTTGAEYPRVMRTEVWDRRMLHTQLASWSHLRHDTLLYAKQSYTAGDCFYPDGWVDPYPELYSGLASFAEEAIPRLETLGIFELPHGHRTRTVLEAFRDRSRQLEAIARAELAGEELSAEQVEVIRTILKPVRGGFGSEGVPFDGWYFDLIFEEIVPADARHNGFVQTFKPTIADVHTDPVDDSNGPARVLHVGVAHPNLMLISVKNGCGTRAYVGPVLSYYEVVRDGLHRMTDEEWEESLRQGAEPPRPEWVYEFVR